MLYKFHRVMIHDPAEALDLAKRYVIHLNESDHTYYCTDLAAKILTQTNVKCKIESGFELNGQDIKIIKPYPALIYDTPPLETIENIVCHTIAKYPHDKSTITFLGREVLNKQDAHKIYLDQPDGKRNYGWKIENGHSSEISMEERFQNISELIRDPDNKCVLSLSGGGIKALAHTVLFRFLNGLGLYENIDEIWGCSAGSIFAYWYASNVHPLDMENNCFDLYNERFVINPSTPVLKIIKNIFNDYVLPHKFRQSDIKDFIDSIQSIQTFIERIMRDSQLERKLYCIAFDITHFKKVVMTPLDFDKELYKNLLIKIKGIDAAVASSSLPALFSPKAIDLAGERVQYIDGAISENVPMKSIYDKWRIDKASGLETRKKLVIIISKLFSRTHIPTKVNDSTDELQFLKLYENALLDIATAAQENILDEASDIQKVVVETPLSDVGPFELKRIPEIISLSQKHILKDLERIEREFSEKKMKAEK